MAKKQEIEFLQEKIAQLEKEKAELKAKALEADFIWAKRLVADHGIDCLCSHCEIADRAINDYSAYLLKKA